MPTIGITGHARLSDESATLIKEALREALRDHDAIHGVTCLAEGADQLFAEAILDAGGTFEVVLPAHDYRDAMIPADNRPTFDKLLARASSVSYMPFSESNRKAFLAAGEELVRRSHQIIAVWDGVPAADVGGTAQVVDVARAAGLPVQVIWPQGARRNAA
ncbi:MAG TPA: hypothetical protein DGG94_16550 [Micromonosporaceae bacterium]|nr:hypothetical protein [Micromonosporaceae bacterium]HCU51381.1 hypothetical protein [Micromonosporaceae bacterium]